MIPLLTEPSDGRQAFHVVAPSIPGYGFSDYSKKVGFGLEQHAQCFAILMKKLGYEKYVCQVRLNHYSKSVLTNTLTEIGWRLGKLYCQIHGFE